MKIGIFGGSFNPIHNGHVSFLQQIKHKLNLDKILIVVCKNSLHKNVNLANKNDRFEMCKKATQHLKYVTVSNLEFEINEKGYSVHTLKIIKQQNLDDELFLIVGYDSFLKIHTWYKFKKILNLAKIVSGYSSEQELKKMNDIILKNKFNATLIKLNLLKCHSTMIRIKLAQNLSCSKFLNNEVENYIKINKLYSLPNALLHECYNTCKNILSKKRFNHCIMVSKEAVTLSKIHGENEKLAQITGILHDIVKEKSNFDLLNIFKLAKINFDNFSEVEKHNPKLWHAPAGAIYCKEILGIENEQILNAITWHTTAIAGMTKFEKIIYLADKTSADRKSFITKIERTLARRNLNKALFFHLKNYFKNALKKNMPIHVNSINCFNELIINKLK